MEQATLGKVPFETLILDEGLHTTRRAICDDNTISTQQPGVKHVEAITLAWTTKSLVVAYAMIWLTYFVEGLLSGTTTALNPFITSAFAEHSLTPTVGILSSVIGGVTNLTVAKVFDVLGRPQGYLLCIVIAAVGLIMMATCRNVEAYAAAQVFYTIGNNGLQYSLSVFVADTSSLRNRGLIQAFAGSPTMITCWLAGPIAAAYIDGAGWRWYFGTFSIVVPAVTLPLFALLAHYSLKAHKANPVAPHGGDRTIWQTFIHYCIEFDAVGLLLLSAGFALFLLPFNLYTFQQKGWNSALVICFLIFGVVLLVMFVLWERFLAPTTFMPYSIILDRTVLGGGLLSATLFISFSSWQSFFSSFLQVVNDLDITKASYVMQANTVSSVMFSIVVGLLIRYTGRYKWVCLYYGIPMSMLATGLMIRLRQHDSCVGYIVMCQILVASASGAVIICSEIAVMAAVSHQHIAAVIAVLGLFGNIGSAAGLTIAAAIWQSTFPKRLAAYLPAAEQPKLLTIYGDISTQLSYASGSPTRVAIQRAYTDAQMYILITGTVVWGIGFVATLMWRDIEVTKVKQVRGLIV